MLDEVPSFVDVATMDERYVPARLADRLPQSRSAVDDAQHRPVEVETALS